MLGAVLSFDFGCVVNEPQAGWGSAPPPLMGKQKAIISLSTSVASWSK